MDVPVLETERLTIRALVEGDLDRVFEIVDRDWLGRSDQAARTHRSDGLQWTILAYQQQRLLDSPPYVLKKLGAI